jgi:hypothetical protein
MLEVERKARVADPADLQRRLLELGSLEKQGRRRTATT